MKIGIDVGGTFTDGVVLEGGRITRWTKIPTVEENLRQSIAGVLDNLLGKDDGSLVERFVVSTTLVTNLLASGRLEKAALVLIPGPGLAPDDICLAADQWVLKGGVDFRGRVIEPVNPEEISRTAREIAARGMGKVAITGKFCQRNPEQEIKVCELLLKEYPQLEILMGHQVSGELNFPRRAVTTLYTLSTCGEWNRLADQIRAETRARNIACPLEVLKADGGTMSLDAAGKSPCETVFSGPAASTMGAYALTMDNKTSVVVDIGGTTSDLAFILHGEPLQASKGAKIGGRYTHVRSLAVRSVAVGGDSTIHFEGGLIKIGPERKGNAACFGGPAATPTDAFNIISRGEIGNLELSQKAMQELVGGDHSLINELAGLVVSRVIEMLRSNIVAMMAEWELEPAYKVWEIVHRRKVAVERIIGIGAAAPMVINQLAESFECDGIVSPYSHIGNALGAAVARPTLQVRAHADTGMGLLTVNGQTHQNDCYRTFQMADVRKAAEDKLKDLARVQEMVEYFDDRQVFLQEQFNIVREWSTTGRIFDVGVMISPGVVYDFKGVDE